MIKLVYDNRTSGRPIELAVTGKAFNVLILNGLIRELLFDIRVFARMTPVDKVQCVRLFMERAVTAMCGDGGNDAGALKASHAGIALTEAESSVVSHFSSRSSSIRSCVELMREGRCSLDVSFACYKYLIMYGEVLAFLGLIQYYFMVPTQFHTDFFHIAFN
jgi:P-type E1-E2 ATPase